MSSIHFSNQLHICHRKFPATWTNLNFAEGFMALMNAHLSRYVLDKDLSTRYNFDNFLHSFLI